MKILFVCEGNINRSPVAEAVCKSLLPDSEVSSAGVYADRAGKRLSEIPHGSVDAMRELGFDISAHIIRQLTAQMVGESEMLVLVGEVPRGPLPDYLENAPNLQRWDVPDPGYGGINIEGARDRVIERVRTFARELQTRKK